ncbi:MAG: hypothetical protein JWQ04_1701 [Pedosphaera sp.]|nr:hypothetical protein [Pedosphaera sp.]
MKKLRSDALWHKLTPEQQAKIQHWFFAERLSYSAVHARMRNELGITCARSILGPIYHYCNDLRSNDSEAIREKLTEAITEPGADLSRVRIDSLTLITGQLIQKAHPGGNPRHIAALGRVLLQAQSRELERERLELMQERISLRRTMTAGSKAAATGSDGLVNNQPSQATRSGTRPG